MGAFVPRCQFAIKGQYAEADALYLRAIQIEERTLGPLHPEFATTLNNRAGLLERQVTTTNASFTATLVGASLVGESCLVVVNYSLRIQHRT